MLKHVSDDIGVCYCRECKRNLRALRECFRRHMERWRDRSRMKPLDRHDAWMAARAKLIRQEIRKRGG